jgi:prepilin-type N-terminal cleavage/methylation domain-containing protein
MSAESGMRNAERITGRAHKGFTLIEIVITIAVIAIAAVGVLSVFATGMRWSADPILISQATQLAQGELDHVVGIKIASGFDAAALPALTNQTCNTQASLLPGFTCTLDICFVPAGALNNTSACGTATTYTYKRVAVTITNARIGSVTAVTLLAKY